MRTRTTLFAIVIAAALAACTRSLPAAFPPSSPISSDAVEAPVADVGRALREDPPLPGESTQGWHGLEPASIPASHGGHDHAR
ncbi:hypothetical protein [Sandaracinus amylolyticus]|uniref:hypothetical protein n=1 Tax=Sandaracinus amylolyticus TaxID=927083 RepID=UPI001F395BE0|nr:hypothetical protein [Sandaracinus amylolyticus]UJR84353.1 Hypothetical protein I5071_64320 [Sandaracinus amylolyticus]